MPDLPFALAVAAGMLAALNPCGFALLPVYLSALVLGDDHPSYGRALTRALVTAAGLSAGFAAVFATFALALTPIAGTVQQHLPWFSIGLGLALVLVGAWLLAGRHLPVFARWTGPAPALNRSALSMAGFGVAYALASLGCTIGPFLAIVASTLRTTSILGGVALLLAYAGGMGLVVATTAVAVASARTAMVGHLRRLAPVVSRAGGAVTLIAGAYVAYYGWYEVRLERGGDPADPVIAGAASLQSRLAQALTDLGPGWLLAALAALLAGAGLVTVWARRRTTADPTAAGPTTADPQALIQQPHPTAADPHVR
jgi:cytochrome c-type biogenesis protein